jgi:hypothetical protein
MGQHVTMHGKTVESFNGQDGKWVPINANSSGQLAIQLLSGELQQFNRLAGGPIVLKSATIAADTNVVPGPCIFYGVKVVTAGTSIIVYDSLTATGQTVINGESTATAGAFITPAGPGVGVLMSTGIFLDLTLGTYIVYYVDAA